jgi:hypothetical protein
MSIVKQEGLVLDPLDMPVYGAEAIGKPKRQTFYALENGYIDADKFGRMWRSTPRRLARVAVVAPDWKPKAAHAWEAAKDKSDHAA